MKLGQNIWIVGAMTMVSCTDSDCEIGLDTEGHFTLGYVKGGFNMELTPVEELDFDESIVFYSKGYLCQAAHP